MVRLDQLAQGFDLSGYLEHLDNRGYEMMAMIPAYHVLVIIHRGWKPKPRGLESGGSAGSTEATEGPGLVVAGPPVVA
jgi:hypothetical protein